MILKCGVLIDCSVVGDVCKSDALVTVDVDVYVDSLIVLNRNLSLTLESDFELVWYYCRSE